MSGYNSPCCPKPKESLRTGFGFDRSTQPCPQQLRAKRRHPKAHCPPGQGPPGQGPPGQGPPDSPARAAAAAERGAGRRRGSEPTCDNPTGASLVGTPAARPARLLLPAVELSAERGAGCEPPDAVLAGRCWCITPRCWQAGAARQAANGSCARRCAKEDCRPPGKQPGQAARQAASCRSSRAVRCAGVAVCKQRPTSPQTFRLSAEFTSADSLGSAPPPGGTHFCISACRKRRSVAARQSPARTPPRRLEVDLWTCGMIDPAIREHNAATRVRPRISWRCVGIFYFVIGGVLASPTYIVAVCWHLLTSHLCRSSRCQSTSQFAGGAPLACAASSSLQVRCSRHSRHTHTSLENGRDISTPRERCVVPTHKAPFRLYA